MECLTFLYVSRPQNALVIFGYGKSPLPRLGVDEDVGDVEGGEVARPPPQRLEPPHGHHGRAGISRQRVVPHVGEAVRRGAGNCN